MNWENVGDWLKNNAGNGVSLVGSLLTGNIRAAIASGVALVTSATGEGDPAKVLNSLQTNPETLLKLKELAQKEEESIREHIRSMTELELTDKQNEHKTTQGTITSGDGAEDVVVRRTRPLQSWLSLIGALAYVGLSKEISTEVLMLLLTLPWTYAGLRQIGKGVDKIAEIKNAK
jgi:hypothetical protein